MIKQAFKSKYPKCTGKPSGYQLGGITCPVVFSVDCILRGTKRAGARCDDIVLFDKLFKKNRKGTGAYLIEKKSHSNDVKKVSAQLRGGAKFIENFTETFIKNDSTMKNCKSDFDFMPIMVSHKLTPSANRQLQRAKIYIFGKKRYIKHVTIGKTLRKF